jgi:hypothetical protein
MTQCDERSQPMLLKEQSSGDAAPLVSRMESCATNLSKNGDDDDVVIALDIVIFGIFPTKDSIVSQNKCVSFDETSRLALLSIPPLEGQGGKDGADERMTEVVFSFGSVVLRWNHSHYWKRREGKLKIEKHLFALIIIIFSIELLLDIS